MSSSTSNRFGVTSVTSAALSALLSGASLSGVPIPFGLALLASIPAILFGILALVRVRQGEESNRSMPIIGIAVGSLAPSLLLVVIVSFLLR